MKTIYVVFGSTGEYSDRTEWPVLAYSSLKNAQKHCGNAADYAREIFGKVKSVYDIPDKLMRSNPYDSKMMMDYTGTSYYIVETTLHE